MPLTPPSDTAMRVSTLDQTVATPFALRPEASQCRQIADSMDLLALRKLSFAGDVAASGDADWQLSGRLGATVVQPCAVTLAPVTTRIDVAVSRLYQRDFFAVDAPEAEMPEDDTLEPLGAWIDPGEVMLEALALHLPEYPRAEGAELGELTVAEAGVTPLRDDDLKPFAGLADLRSRMTSSKDPEASED